MHLLFDIGNSTIDWAIEVDNKINPSNKFIYQKAELLSQLESQIRLADTPSAVLLSCVAEEDIIKTLEGWVRNKWQLDLWQAVVTSSFNELQNSYHDTRQMGVDRWLAMIAARDKYKNALCVVGCGTATTVDLIDNIGTHMGGYIVPGVEMMQQALISNTDKIKVTVSDKIAINFANNTQTAINNGASVATVAMIDRAVDMLTEQLNSEPKCIITGGMAEKIKPLLKASFEYDKDLVLQGLSIMYRTGQ